MKRSANDGFKNLAARLRSGFNAGAPSGNAAIGSIFDLIDRGDTNIIDSALTICAADENRRAHIFPSFEAFAPSAPAEHAVLHVVLRDKSLSVIRAFRRHSA